MNINDLILFHTYTDLYLSDEFNYLDQRGVVGAAIADDGKYHLFFFEEMKDGSTAIVDVLTRKREIYKVSFIGALKIFSVSGLLLVVKNGGKFALSGLFGLSEDFDKKMSGLIKDSSAERILKILKRSLEMSGNLLILRYQKVHQGPVEVYFVYPHKVDGVYFLGYKIDNKGDCDFRRFLISKIQQVSLFELAGES
jgi:hypothetical protein